MYGEFLFQSGVCLALQTGMFSYGSWLDFDCGTARPFLCEYEQGMIYYLTIIVFNIIYSKAKYKYNIKLILFH